MEISAETASLPLISYADDIINAQTQRQYGAIAVLTLTEGFMGYWNTLEWIASRHCASACGTMPQLG